MLYLFSHLLLYTPTKVMENTSSSIDSQRESTVPWICRSTWLTLLPDEILFHIISYATQPKDFLSWNTCCRKIGIICHDTNLINIMKERFTKSRVELSDDEKRLHMIYNLPNGQVVRVMAYEIYGELNVECPIYRLYSKYDFVNNILHSYFVDCEAAEQRSYRDIVDNLKILNEFVEIVESDNKNIVLFGSVIPTSTCSIKDGKPQGLYHNLEYNIEIKFENGRMESYKDEHTFADRNINNKLNMVHKSENCHIKIVDSVIKLFDQVSKKNRKRFYYNSDDLDNSIAIDKAIRKLFFNWGILLPVMFLVIIESEPRFLDSSLFMQSYVCRLTDYDVYKN